jgi:hypothetical protein
MGLDMNETHADMDKTVEIRRRERRSVEHALRAETAQVLALVLVEIANLTRVQDVPELHTRLGGLRDAVRTELGRVRKMADVLAGKP